MPTTMFKKIFGTKNSRELRRLSKQVAAINALEDSISNLSQSDILARTDDLKKQVAGGVALDQLLPEAFAIVREVARREKNMRHFDVQLIGGIALHEGKIAEMRTGEGKTLVATLAAYLNALSGRGVHIVTVNDYLARRDASWMAPIYEALGLSVGVIQSGQTTEDKKRAYEADITYGTNNEFGFDYLRDNMAFSLEDKFQRELNYAIVDEVDSILVDEARTPLIISGAAEESTTLYKKINRLAPSLTQQITVDTDVDKGELSGDFIVDEKNRQIELTESGHEKIENELIKVGLLEGGDSLYAASNLNLLHHIQAALKAHFLFSRDVDYMVSENEVVIVDEHTGRAMPGRRWSEGIHQAIEAKEAVPIQNETQTLASTTFQNYFRLYRSLSGMTGTADTEAFEFRQIYGLDVVVIPTHQPMVRQDFNDLVYLTIDEKYDAIVEDINSCIEKGQPVLVGTASIESSERLSEELNKRGISHSVLNAKQHEKEADIIAQAGKPGVVTLATNMAGRGTDIVLGGNWEAGISNESKPNKEQIDLLREEWDVSHKAVIDAGGLHIIGTERHDSRRIDNQLRGRSGRQGDPGSSRFYLSMEDSLMRIFASERMRGIMQSIGMEKGEAIEHRMINNAIENAQRKVEGHNFDVRKNLLEFDDVSNDQRQVIYQQRRDIMEAASIADTIENLREEIVFDLVYAYLPPESLEEQWDIEGLENGIASEFSLRLPVNEWLTYDDELVSDSLAEKILQRVTGEYQEKERLWGNQSIDIRIVEKQIMLQVLDQRWKEHLATMDHLRQGIHLRAYAQKQPKQEYKRESFELFQQLLTDIKRDVIRLLSRVQFEDNSEVLSIREKRRESVKENLQFNHDSSDILNEEVAPIPSQQAKSKQTFVRSERKVGRNEPCPCGSGVKYKLCHGKT
ncbi:MAG: preprotein translocase subunit SecA [Gammaproteobacteria bacterium]|nr:preprotein translocase subunit SecA [Gammaproteobacteria bacterium]